MVYFISFWLYLHPKRYKMDLSGFVKEKRKAAGLTQPDLAGKAGVGLRFLRELEQGKSTLRLDKVNQILALFGYKAGPVKIQLQTDGHEKG